jgi:hypothetical protein
MNNFGIEDSILMPKHVCHDKLTILVHMWMFSLHYLAST